MWAIRGMTKNSKARIEMSEIKNGGPAFPLHDARDFPVKTVDELNRLMSGMTLRDYFAAKAMQGLIAGSGDANGDVEYGDAAVAKSAYAMADAMLHARDA
jgi:hypothetical protein